MPIKSIQIENYKSIRNSGPVEIRPLNVLIGGNGVGKSNFIGFFKLLRKINDQQLRDYVASNGYADRLLYFGTKKSQYLGGEIIFRDEQDTHRNSYNFRLKANKELLLYFDDERGGYWTTTRKFSPNSDWDYITTNSIGKLESEFKKAEGHRFDYISQYFQSFKIFHFHDTGDTSALKKDSRLEDNLFLREDGSNLAAFLYMLREVHPKYYKFIEHTIRSVAPFFDRFDLQPRLLQEESIRLTWKEKGSDEYFDASNLSDGTLRFIALTTLLLQPNPPAVVIIDEPELGLHPVAIGKLSAMLKSVSGRCQIIVSTQSVNLLDDFTAEDIIVVDRVDGQSQFVRLESESLKNWLDGYSIGELWTKNILRGTP